MDVLRSLRLYDAHDRSNNVGHNIDAPDTQRNRQAVRLKSAPLRFEASKYAEVETMWQAKEVDGFELVYGSNI